MQQTPLYESPRSIANSQMSFLSTRRMGKTSQVQSTVDKINEQVNMSSFQKASVCICVCVSGHTILYDHTNITLLTKLVYMPYPTQGCPKQDCGIDSIGELKQPPKQHDE